MTSKDVGLHLGSVKVIETSKIYLIPFPFTFLICESPCLKLNRSIASMVFWQGRGIFAQFEVS